MKFKILLLVALMAVMASCGNSGSGANGAQQVKCTDIEVKGEKDSEKAYYDGKPFTGDIVTSSGRTFVSCKDGKPVSIVVTYENGKKALEVSLAEGEGAEPVMYDKDGNKISEPGMDNIGELMELFDIMQKESKEFGALEEILK